jgi:hypothetical protein
LRQNFTFDITPARLLAVIARVPVNNARLLTKLVRISDGEDLALTMRQAADVQVLLTP